MNTPNSSNYLVVPSDRLNQYVAEMDVNKFSYVAKMTGSTRIASQVSSDNGLSEPSIKFNHIP
jgi:hypothetical protein